MQLLIRHIVIMGCNSSKIDNPSPSCAIRAMPCAVPKQASCQIIADQFTTLDQVMTDLRVKGLESCNLIVGIDCTKSNTWSKLHNVSTCAPTPYEQVLSVIARTLTSFDDDGSIPFVGFGDSLTTNKSVFSFSLDGDCKGLDDMLRWYRHVIPRIQLLGPTSLAPLIRYAIDIVRTTGKYHVLVVITDGMIDDISATTAAIMEATKYPLSIVCVGVGPGPWATMNEYDDGLPERDFDNFQFVEFSRVAKGEHADTAFAVAALQEIPEQYRTIKRRGLLDIKNAEPIGSKNSETVAHSLLVFQPATVYAGVPHVCSLGAGTGIDDNPTSTSYATK